MSYLLKSVWLFVYKNVSQLFCCLYKQKRACWLSLMVVTAIYIYIPKAIFGEVFIYIYTERKNPILFT